MSMARIFLFPSYYEGFGVPVIEAMACGTPVITTTASSLPEVGGKAAAYIEPGKADELAYRIQNILEHEELQKEMVRKGYDNIKRYQWDTIASQMERLFDE